MKQLLLGVTLAVALAGGANAAVYTEVGDAGQTVSTAQATGSGGAALTQIFGMLGTTTDADLYSIYISNPSTFSASTINTVTNNSFALDTELFLFTTAGVGIAVNDDGNGSTFDAALPSGNSLYGGLSAGYYLIGISNSSNEPVNSASQLIFSPPPGGDTTAVRGPASGLNPTTEATFNGFQNSEDNGPGSYEIDLTGVSAGPAVTVSAAPEPGAWALMLGGVGAMGLMLRGRRRQPRLARVAA